VLFQANGMSCHKIVTIFC